VVHQISIDGYGFLSFILASPVVERQFTFAFFALR